MNSLHASHTEEFAENGKGRYETKEIPSAEVDRQLFRIRRKRILKEFSKVYIVSLAVFMVMASILFANIHILLDKVWYATAEDMVIPDGLDSLYVKSDSSDWLSTTVLTDKDMELAERQLAQIRKDRKGLIYAEGVTNILLLGTDGHHPTSKNARSDVIIILSINNNSGKLVISSIMRDIYVHIPGRTENEKITHAHVYGGPALTIKTIEENFGIRIDRFASINYYAFMDIVDALGGIDVPIHGNEHKLINSSVAELNYYMGLGNKDGFLYETGDSVHLTGKQALGFVRNRRVENSDYARADHQRMVLEQLITRAQEADYKALMDTADAVASNLYTNLSSQEILQLAMDAGKYKNYELVQFRVPDESTESVGGVYKGHWVLRIDMEANRELLAKAIYEQ